MFNLDNIDLKQEHSSLKEEVKSLKSYVWQLVEELKFRFEDSESESATEYVDSATAAETYATKDELNEKIAKNTVTRTVRASTGTVTLSNNTPVSICAVTLEAGLWLLTGNISYAGDRASGYRAACIATKAEWDSECAGAAQIGAAPTGYKTIVNAFDTRQPTAKTTYYLIAWQTSGGDLDVKSGVLHAIRLK